MKRQLAVLAALPWLFGCAGWTGPADDRGAADLAAALHTVAEFRGGSYRISPSDLVSVAVYPDERLNSKARVDAEGILSLALIGTVAVAGATLPEAERAIERRLSTYLVEPHVSLVIEEYGNRRVFVMGEVQRPGSYAVPAGSRMTALQAISEAGGFTTIAAPHRTVLLRYTENRRVDRVIDLRTVIRGHSDRDVVVEPDDIVFVPQSYF